MEFSRALAVSMHTICLGPAAQSAIFALSSAPVANHGGVRMAFANGEAAVEHRVMQDYGGRSVDVGSVESFPLRVRS